MISSAWAPHGNRVRLSSRFLGYLWSNWPWKGKSLVLTIAWTYSVWEFEILLPRRASWRADARGSWRPRFFNGRKFWINYGREAYSLKFPLHLSPEENPKLLAEKVWPWCLILRRFKRVAESNCKELTRSHSGRVWQFFSGIQGINRRKRGNNRWSLVFSSGFKIWRVTHEWHHRRLEFSPHPSILKITNFFRASQISKQRASWLHRAGSSTSGEWIHRQPRKFCSKRK